MQIPYCSQSPPKATERETQQHYGDRAAPYLPAAGLDDRLCLQMANVYMSRNSQVPAERRDGPGQGVLQANLALQAAWTCSALRLLWSSCILPAASLLWFNPGRQPGCCSISSARSRPRELPAHSSKCCRMGITEPQDFNSLEGSCSQRVIYLSRHLERSPLLPSVKRSGVLE